VLYTQDADVQSVPHMTIPNQPADSTQLLLRTRNQKQRTLV